MISISSSPPAETEAAYTLLSIIADPARAKKHLDALVAEKQAAIEAQKAATDAQAAAKAHYDAAVPKLAAAQKLMDDYNLNHKTRTASLDDRHETLLAKDRRLTEYEASVAAREAELQGPLLDREKAVAAKEAGLAAYEAELKAIEADLAKAKEAFDARVRKIKEATA